MQIIGKRKLELGEKFDFNELLKAIGRNEFYVDNEDKISQAASQGLSKGEYRAKMRDIYADWEERTGQRTAKQASLDKFAKSE